jgi:hypothetical protein
MGVDPGVTTGWAIGWFDRDSIFGNSPLFPAGEEGCREIIYGQFVGNEDRQADDLIDKAIENNVDVMVIEDFELRKLLKSRELLSPVRIGHKISYGMYIINARGSRADRPLRIEWQLPALAMSTATDERLKLWGVYHRGQQHARDGVRHVVTFARRAKDKREIRDRIWN